MATIGYLLGALAFFALIMASIALHEVGHLVPAKIFGVKVNEYFIGFGRTLWKKRFGSTDYGVKAIPLGGYVKLVGMYPPATPRVAAETTHDPHGAPVAVEATNSNAWARVADSARAYEWEDIRPEDDGTLLYQKPVWQRLLIMSGGPLMNLAIAFVLFWLVIGVAGVYRPTLEVTTVSECVVPAERAEQTCQPGDVATPAHAMGIRPGDVLVSFNDTAPRNWEHLSDMIRTNLSEPATIVVERDGERVTLPTVPTVTTGVPSEWDPGRRVEAGFLGVSPTMEHERGGPVVVVQDMWDMSRQSAHALARFPVKVYNTAADLVTGQERDVYGPISVVGASRVAGEVVTTDVLASNDKVATFVQLLASVNLFVALFNLVPLPPLDGGHILGALWDGLRRALARVLRRPEPAPFDTARLLPISWAVTAFVIVAGGVLIIADLVDPVRLF